jgi:hypothetical protein
MADATRSMMDGITIKLTRREKGRACAWYDRR